MKEYSPCKRTLILMVIANFGAFGQKIETQKPDRIGSRGWARRQIT